MTLDELLKDFLDKSYEELVALGKVAYADIDPVVRAIDAENDGYVMMTSVILSAIGADGTLTALENRFLKDVFGFNDAKIDALLMLYNNQTEDMTDMLFDHAEEEFQASLLTFVMCILAVDKEITREETAFVLKLLAKPE
ncbi:MAG: hypothetical protein E7553_06510 [Ruminococcaceae bacterium]|nr:hypothetical protein [Oscillospiraceae bacterium]